MNIRTLGKALFNVTAILLTLFLIFVIIIGVPVPLPLSEEEQEDFIYRGTLVSSDVIWDLGWRNPSLVFIDVILIDTEKDGKKVVRRFFQSILWFDLREEFRKREMKAPRKNDPGGGRAAHLA